MFARLQQTPVFRPGPVTPRIVRSAATLLGAMLVPALFAQVVPVPVTPQIGSSNPVSAEPPIVRPTTTPCTVTLFTNLEFADFNNKPISYTPPSSCPGPWSKVVFNADFTVTEGRQFDRTAKFFLGGANIYFGTTAEPRAALSPSWHVESDVTDLSALFHAPQTGQAILGNFVGVSGGVTYNGLIYATATLQFYPASARNPAPVVPSAVLSLPGTNDTTRLSSSTDVLANTLTLPRNVERAYLDVFAQSQSSDEFWYLSAPSDVAGELATSGNTAFRETEITIDGRPAGVALVYPWIYTGGIDPALWEPLPGVETLSFKPYRVDLSPFAGVLSDGNQHTVSLSVFNANSGFDVTATLLLYTDPNRENVTGAVTEDTLAGTPKPAVTENLTTAADSTVSGTIAVTAARPYRITGYVDTSAGRITTDIVGRVNFRNAQVVKVNANTFSVDNQSLVQDGEVYESITRTTGLIATTEQRAIRYPLTLSYAFTQAADGSYVQSVSSVQQKLSNTTVPLLPGITLPLASFKEVVHSADTISVSAAGVASYTGLASATSYSSQDLLTGCSNRELTSANLKLTSARDTQTCP